MRLRVRTLAILLLTIVGAAACGEDGPSGPGNVTVEISWDAPLGAATLELAGTGIEGVTVGADDWIADNTTPAGRRVVVVSRSGGTLAFQVAVADLGAPLPTVTVLRASTVDGVVLRSPNGLEVSVRR